MLLIEGIRLSVWDRHRRPRILIHTEFSDVSRVAAQGAKQPEAYVRDQPQTRLLRYQGKRTGNAGREK